MIASDTNAWPTGVRTTVAPWGSATRSTRPVVDTFVTTGPMRRPRAASTASGRVFSSESGRPVYDSVAAALWGTLALAGVDPNRIAGWGEIFSVAPASLERLGALA